MFSYLYTLISSTVQQNEFTSAITLRELILLGRYEILPLGGTRCFINKSGIGAQVCIIDHTL
jgi:hypothetical protein